ncbi:zinc finger MYM-type protein 1-like [Mercenaria mercenaria]|uniref:zinc finger MYM-type protein 1-like n=1 Tax=Mercenaria mercenaria TaxID=6596 RepID=UPI00234EFE3D|nr:zinc finger MYM-type protein 1-like [Mercenaria mercenaria]
MDFDEVMIKFLKLAKDKKSQYYYDGASNMSGAKKGVATQLSSREPRAVYTHCYGHALNLAVGDTVKRSKVMRDALDTVNEMSKLIKYSPKRDSKLEEIKQEMSPETPGFRVLCPTRWTVRAASLGSVLENYNVLQSLWESSYESARDSETRARILGVQSHMSNFDFLFGVSLGYEILRHTDNLSKCLQNKDMSAVEGQHLSKITLGTLSDMRKDDAYDKFWESVNEKLDTLDVSEPVMPRRRKMPKRFETGEAPHEFHATEKDLYRQKYYEALDLAVNCVQDRFDQPGYKSYRHLEDMVLKCVTNDSSYLEDMDFVVDFYKDDIDRLSLKSQLESLKVHARNSCDNVSNVTVSDVTKLLTNMKPASRAMFSEIVTVLKLILVMPATNATSERSFSALRRLKTYLRSNMTEKRLNHIMTLHIHREATDSIDLDAVANEFVNSNDSRLSIFGKV